MKLLDRLGLVTANAAILAGTLVFAKQAPLAAEPARPSAQEPPSSSCGGDAVLRNLLKGTLAGMKVKDKVVLYDEQGLFNYIDGGAPLYIKHHFRRLGAAELGSDSSGELTCDVYDMNGPANAAAVFASEKSAALKPVPGWSQAGSGPLFFSFHQGCYYVKLTAFDKKSEKALPELATALRERITGPSAAPARK
jgi:hypothetical protein